MFRKTIEMLNPFNIWQEDKLHQTIGKLKTALHTSNFAMQTNRILVDTIHILENVSKEGLEQATLNAKYNIIVVGMITLARLAQCWKYGQECPKEGEEIVIDILNQNNLGLLAYQNTGDEKSWYTAAMTVGYAVLVDKTIPLYPANEKFSSHGLAIQQLLIDVPQEEYSRFASFAHKTKAKENVIPANNIDRQFHSTPGPIIISLS